MSALPLDVSQPSAATGLPDASRRLRALAALSGSLTDALDPEEAARLVEEKALTALGATSAVVVTLGPFPPTTPPPAVTAGGFSPLPPTTLHVVDAIGLPAEIRASLEQLPLHAPVPFAEVARGGVALFLANGEEMLVYPDWGKAMLGAGSASAAIVPVWANGELRGVLGLTWADAHIFDEDERAFVLTLGIMCAQSIMRAHLKSAEREARAAAEHANLAKTRFVANISHELRTPINAVLGYTQLLSDGIDGPVSTLQQQHLRRVSASGKHLLGLVEDLLGFARLDAGEEIVQPRNALLRDVVDASVALVAPMADVKGLAIVLEMPEEPIVLLTDVRKLQQVLVNVLANAVKYSTASPVSVSVHVTGTAPTSTIFLRVTDIGLGIAEENHDRVFDPFWQGSPASVQRDGSTGLGLSVARQLARLLRGDLYVEQSTLQKGTTFACWLPTHFVIRGEVPTVVGVA